MPAQSTAFGDLLDPRFQKIFHEEIPQLEDMLPELYNFVPHNGRDVMTWSEIGAFEDWADFGGSVDYQDVSQGYDVTMTYLEKASGFKVERKLFDDDQFHIMDQRTSGLATAYKRGRQKDGARMFNNAASVDTRFYSHSEAVALVSNSHTTLSGASTATGFDNLVTTAFSAVSLASARIQARKFRDDNANRMDVNMDEIWFGTDLYEKVFEVIESMGKVDTAENNRNVHHGAYKMLEWNYMDTDSNNWFITDSSLRRMFVKWVDRIGVEFAFAEDMDTIIAKWRGYGRYANAHLNWRWILGGIVN